jgi:hypothetical protein
MSHAALDNRAMKNLRPETLGIVQRVEALSGCPVEFKPDSSLSIQATLQKARHGAKSHVLSYKPGTGSLDYWVAYQCGFALRFFALPPDQRFDFVDTGEGVKQVATLLVSGQSLSQPDIDRVPMFARQIEHWALMTLLSYPLGIRVDQWLHAEYPALRAVQREGMQFIQQENQRLLSMAMGRLTLPVPLLGMPAAYSLLADELLGTRVHAIPYRAAGVMGMGETLHDLSVQVPNDPVHDRELIDAWAQALGMSDWFTWQPYKILA